MMEQSLSNQGLPQLITTRIIRDGSVTLSQLEHRATERGVSLSELYAALERVHRDKRVERTVKAGEVIYRKAMPKKSPLDHHTWLREHYPPMDETNDGSGIDIDLSWLFLKPDELVEYKAAAKGVPKHMIQFRHDKPYTR